jgi:hypothetical protein
MLQEKIYNFERAYKFIQRTYTTMGGGIWAFPHTTFWTVINKQKQTNSVVWVRERTIPSDRRLSAKLLQTFADRGCHVVSVMDPYGRILDFQDRSRYFFFQVAPQLYSRGWVDPVTDPLLLRKSSSAGNRTRASGSVARNSDHWHNVAKHCKFDARGTVVPSTATASDPTFEIEIATFTSAKRTRCVLVRRN